jgi:hypothetical protein
MLLNHIPVSLSLTLLPPTPSPVVAHLPSPDLNMTSQLQHEVLDIDDRCDSSDDDTMNGEVEDIVQEGDFMVITELDHASVMLLGDADGEDGDANRGSDDELE